MTLALLLAVSLSPVFADSVQVLYAQSDAAGLADYCDTADGQAEDLLCAYRLYPLTEDDAFLEDLPETLSDDASASEVALLAGLWGYRASRGSMIQTIRSGRRASSLLERARTLDPDDPYLLLIEGQSLLFRPALFGGDTGKALDHFQRLRTQLEHEGVPGMAAIEVDVWIWYTLAERGSEQADVLRRNLLDAEPPSLYREMLQSNL